jgi:hypothetical protein
MDAYIGRTERQGSRRIGVEYSTPSALPNSPHETMKQMQEKRATLLAVSPEQTIAMMQSGRPFHRYYEDERNNVVRYSICILLDIGHDTDVIHLCCAYL